MYKKGENVIITKCSAPKLPNVKDTRNFRMSIIRGTTMLSHEKPVKTHILPGIGTFVIDTPKDKELSARQRCFRYQEAHRGFVRSKTKAFPDIPKRCDMKNLPIVQLRDLNAKSKENRTPPTRHMSPVEGQGQSVSPSLAESRNSCPSAEDSHEKFRKQEPASKTQSQDGRQSQSPPGHFASNSGEHPCLESPALVNGFGVRRGKSVVATIPRASSRREFTNLSKNLLLAEPESTPCKATERELESQAEYRKQLTFYLSQMFEAEQNEPKKLGKEDTYIRREPTDVYDENIQVDNVGHTSKHQEWESSISLGEMLINTTPDLRKRLKLDFKIRETGSGKSSHDTPDMGKYSGKNLAAKGVDSLNDRTFRNIKTNATSNNHNVSRDSHVVFCVDRLNLSPEKSPLPPKRRPTNTNFENTKLKDNVSNGSLESKKKTERWNNLANEKEEEEEDVEDVLNIQEHVFLQEDEYEEENDDSEDEDDEGDIVDEKWLHMVNTPVVESGVYDRYANVKLPPSWLQPPSYNSQRKTPTVKNGISGTSGHRGVQPGACALSGGGSTSLSTTSGKAVGFLDRNTAGRVK